MKKLVFYTLLLVTTVTICRSDEESIEDEIEDEIEGETDESSTGGKMSYLPYTGLFSTIKDPIMDALNAIKRTVYKKADEIIMSAYNTTAELANTIATAINSTVYKKAGEIIESAYNATAKFAHAIATVVNTTKNTVYKKVEEVYNKTAEFVDNVRTVIREELSNFFLTYFLWDSSVISDPEFDSSYQKLHKVLVHKVMLIGLVIICLVLSYIFYKCYCGYIHIIAFNFFVFLLYGIMEPENIYWLFGSIIYIIWCCISFIYTYPYTSISAFMGAYIYMFIGEWITWCYSICHRIKSKIREKRVENNIDTRLERIEKQQKEILEQQKEILKWLQNKGYSNKRKRKN